MPPLREVFGEARSKFLADLGSGDARLIARRYVLGALAVGLVLGCLLVAGSATGALLVMLLAGGALGYGARSYVSHRRRSRFLAGRG